MSIYCESCKSLIAADELELTKLDTKSYWTNDGDRVVFHVCPICGNSVEGIDYH